MTVGWGVDGDAAEAADAAPAADGSRETIVRRLLTVVAQDLPHEYGGLDVRPGGWLDMPHSESVMLSFPDGSAVGLGVDVWLGPARQLASVADQLQEAVVQDLWRRGGSAVWPHCPDHPDSHPMQALVVSDQAVWTCLRTGRVVAAIGGLADDVAREADPVSGADGG